MFIPELLAPAGSPQALDAAVGEGADAVYLGLQNFNARARSTNFTYAQCEAAIKTLHKMRRKLYVTLNTVFEQREADQVYQILKYLSAVGPDGVIVQDLGILTMLRTYFPNLKVHASTQMNIASSRAANTLSKYGVSRVVLARELSFVEIQNIRSSVNVELECFVHGSLCMSVSGLCLFSSYLGGKSANRGLCTQACRRLFHNGDTSGYYFSPFDLQLIEHVYSIACSGVNSLKIEGRMKSAEYTAAVVRAYRVVLDSLDKDEEARRDAMQKASTLLKSDLARTKTQYRFEGYSNIVEPARSGASGMYLGDICGLREVQGLPQAMLQKGDFTLNKGDSIRVQKADDSLRQNHKLVSAVMEEGQWRISIPKGFGISDSVYLIQTKSSSMRYKAVLPRNLSPYKRTTGMDRAPEIVPSKDARKDALEDGIYASVSRVSDLYILQSIRPVKAMLALTESNVGPLCADNNKALPFKPENLILVLDPFFPQSREESLAKMIRALLNRGYNRFVLNNIGHFSFFRGSSALLIGGPYLYTFNRFSFSFVQKLGAKSIITPFENNRQNVERTVDKALRPSLFITVFAYPALFRIYHSLDHDFTDFSDGYGAKFRFVKSESKVIPKQAFSLVDKIPFLKEAGFTKFIVDLSGEPVKKSVYKNIMNVLLQGAPIPDCTRFNWKNGFYSAKQL